jgi:nitroreductase
MLKHVPVATGERPATQSSKPMAAMDAIQARRSVRSYVPQRLDRASVTKLLSAAVRAPTAVHQEPWAFVVVQDPDTLKRLSDTAKPMFAREVHRASLDHGGHGLDVFAKPDFDIFYNASTLIVICGPSAAPFAAADCWLAAENLMIAACAMGFGTCVIGSALAALNLPEVKAELGIPAGFSAIAPIVVGLACGETPLTSRKEPRVLAWR